MITYQCDQCRHPVSDTIRVTLTYRRLEKHFCTLTCAQEYATGDRPAPTPTQPAEAPAAAPEPAPAPQNMVRAQDAVKHTCEICGREGTRRYERTATGGWRCAPTATCARKTKQKPASDSCAKPEPPQVKSPAPRPTVTVKPPPAESPVRTLIRAVNTTTPPTPGVTARCQDCTRTWTLTGRVLQQAIEMHEIKHGHIVNTTKEATA